MTGVYIEDTLKALNKIQLNAGSDGSTTDSLMAEMNSSFKRLELDVQIVKTVNNNLLKQLDNTEKQRWANAQYLRREYVDLIDIPKTGESKDFEHTLCKVFNSIGFNIG